MTEKKLFRKSLKGYGQRVTVMVFVTLLITFLISYFKELEFGLILGYAGMAVTAIGGVGGMGGGRGAGESIHLQVLSTGKMNRNTMKNVQQSYSFSIFMIISGIIVMLISVIV